MRAEKTLGFRKGHRYNIEDKPMNAYIHTYILHKSTESNLPKRDSTSTDVSFSGNQRMRWLLRHSRRMQGGLINNNNNNNNNVSFGGS